MPSLPISRRLSFDMKVRILVKMILTFEELQTNIGASIYRRRMIYLAASALSASCNPGG